ncbi:MAG TPA: DUF547 domain-containing protein, partial [Candidatus Eisenbacteria bacterium]|nr:DUF547 domain-containing protein [Candidatus Eisenbacteria bacterium]
AAAALPPALSAAEDGWDALLRAHVHAGRVDYLTLRDRDGAALDSVLARFARVDAAALAPADRLAYWINLYNATMVAAVCARFRAGWTPAADSFDVFHAPLVHAGGTAMSLDELEHRRIRPQAHDPRVHVALNCAARSCPPLRDRAYRGDDLDSVLAANLKRFVDDPERNRVDRAARTLALSRVFDWYADDFGGAAAVPAYVGRVAGVDAAGWKVMFLDYDWRLNLAPPAAGEWVVVTATSAVLGRAPAGRGAAGMLSRGEVVRVAGRTSALVRVVRPGGAGEGWLPAGDVRPWHAE